MEAAVPRRMHQSACWTRRRKPNWPAAASGSEAPFSDPGGQPDRQPRAGLDRRRDQLIAERLGGAMLDRHLTVRQFVGAEGEDLDRERRVGVAQPLGLAVIMLVDDLL